MDREAEEPGVASTAEVVHALTATAMYWCGLLRQGDALETGVRELTTCPMCLAALNEPITGDRWHDVWKRWISYHQRFRAQLDDDVRVQAAALALCDRLPAGFRWPAPEVDSSESTKEDVP